MREEFTERLREARGAESAEIAAQFAELKSEIAESEKRNAQRFAESENRMERLRAEIAESKSSTIRWTLGSFS